MPYIYVQDVLYINYYIPIVIILRFAIVIYLDMWSDYVS